MIMILVVSMQDPDRLAEMRTQNPPATSCQIVPARCFNAKLQQVHKDLSRQLRNRGIYNGRS